MKFYRLFLLIAFAGVFGSYADAQQITVLNKYPGNETVDSESYVLKNVQQHTIIINEYEQVSSGDNRLQEMIGFSIRSYIDHNFFITGGQIKALKNPEKAEEDLTAIVKNAIWIMDFEFDQDFTGFSTRVSSALKTLHSLHGRNISPARTAVEIPLEGLVPQYAFQKSVYETKVLIESEVADFLKNYGQEINQSRLLSASPGAEPEKEMGPVFLEPLDFELDFIDPDEYALADLKPQLRIGEPKQTSAEVKKSELQTEQLQTKSGEESISEQQAFFNTKILELLEDNNKILASYNKRFASMQDQIDLIKNEQMEAQKKENQQIRQELAELREMVMTVISGKNYSEKDGSLTRKLELDPVRLVFQKNQYELSYQQKLLLDQVRKGLEQHQDYRVLITGFADKSGDREFNNWISRQRALEVKKYLESFGIENDRLVVNYFGETRSTEPNPDDRRVDVEWLVNFTAQNSTP